jgi:putative acetyltransferase
MDANFHIEKAILTDLPQILDVFQNAIKVTAKEFYSQHQIIAWANTIYSRKKVWEFRIENEEFVVAKIEDEIVGFAALKSLDYFDLLFVAPHVGRKGIAGLMYDYLEEKIPSGTLLKTDASKLSLPFFLKNGFVQIAENKVDLLGVEIPNYRMQKVL